MEIIKKIEKIGFKVGKTEYMGYAIRTDLQDIKIGIDDKPQCYENYGCIYTNDDISDFTGAELKDIQIVNNALNNKRLNIALCNAKIDLDKIMFVNFETNKGTLQFVAYNDHKGYYGHDVILMSRQLNHEDCL